MTKVHLIAVMDPAITPTAAMVMATAFNMYGGELVGEMDEAAAVRLEFPDRVQADAFKQAAAKIGQTVFELQ